MFASRKERILRETVYCCFNASVYGTGGVNQSFALRIPAGCEASLTDTAHPSHIERCRTAIVSSGYYRCFVLRQYFQKSTDFSRIMLYRLKKVEADE